jgi:hypothetical protein
MKWILSRRDNILVERDRTKTQNPVGMTLRCLAAN